jgi:VWFA-related protein
VRRLAARPGRPLALATLLVLPALPAGHAAAQPPTFEEATDVVEVQIPVNVLDKSGRPIHGLTAGDFKVLDDGKRQEVTAVRVADLEVLETAPGRSEDAMVPSAARRHFLLLFDISFSTPATILKAREAARDFVLETLHPTDLVAVATFSLETGPRLLVTFTPDRAQVARAIETLGARRLLDARGALDPLAFMIDTPRGIGRLGVTPIDDVGNSTTRIAQQQALIEHLNIIAREMDKLETMYERGKITSWARTLEALARTLASIEGRKHVVYFSEGFDGRLMLGRRPDAEDPRQQADRLNLETGQFWMVDTDDIYGNSTLQLDAAAMVEAFRRADCVVQSVDIAGLRADTTTVDRARKVGQDVLFYLANETGGELFQNANDFGDQLAEVLQRSSLTYVLTIAPKGLVADGSYHRLKVDTDVPGARVVHRAGYFAPRPFEDLHPLEKNLLASDAIASAAPRSDLRVDVLTAPFHAGDGSAYLPVIVEVAGADLLAGEVRDQLSVEIFAYASDSEGTMRDFFSQMVSLDLGNGRETLRRGGLKYYGHLVLPPGDYLVRVLARDAATGRSGVRAVPVAVPDLANASRLLTPFFFDTPGRWLLVREQNGAGDDAHVVYPFTVKGEPYVPAARPLLARGESARMCLVGYNLSGGELQIEGSLSSAAGENPRTAPLTLVERTVAGIGGIDKLLASFRTEGVAAGDYLLSVAVVDAASGARHESSIPITIR